MALMVPLPQPVRDLVKFNTHPGLMLDKYVASWDPQAEPGKLSERVQKEAIKKVVDLSQGPPPGLDFAALVGRWQHTLAAVGAATFSCRTAGPLTLHLARASALENAGICLHPIYGFVFLPGSGLKGMARAYATTVAGADHEQITAVFGNKPGEPESAQQRAGGIVFHDAWPTAWPRLVTDILNNHHVSYYRDGKPPGDWDAPVPVNFLAVPENVGFLFAVSKRRDDLPDELLQLARQWLLGALTHAGAGAKTAAGYGSFQLDVRDESDRRLESSEAADWSVAQAAATRVESRHEVELITPAFLAGAQQQREDCELRPATVRGQLRWWWRTLHAGFLDGPMLQALEAAIWGDTLGGGAVRTTVQAVQAARVERFDFKERFDVKPEFKRRHALADRPDKTTQGLFYISYGMDDGGPRDRRQRWYADAGATWTIGLTARPARFLRRREDLADPKKQHAGEMLAADVVLRQAQAALWLLCTYGGIGSKARKGFGSLQLTGQTGNDWSLDQCRELAAELRAQLQLGNDFSEPRAASPALGTRDWPVIDQTETAWDDPWQVLDAVGFAYQAYAQQNKHQRVKAALGLPRKIHGPRDNGPITTREGRPVQDPKTWQPPEHLDFPGRDPKTPVKDARHASPIHLHLARSANGLTVRLLAFPSPRLPDLTTSRRVLTEFRDRFAQALNDRTAQRATRGGPPMPAVTPGGKRPHGTPVRVTIVGTREKKGGYLVQEAGKPRGILTLGPVPDPPPAVNAEVDAFVHDDDPRNPQYRWDRPQATGSAQRPPPRGGRGKPPPRRR